MLCLDTTMLIVAASRIRQGSGIILKGHVTQPLLDLGEHDADLAFKEGGTLRNQEKPEEQWCEDSKNKRG